MTRAVYWVLVAALVLCNPLFAGLPAEHAAHDDTRSGNWFMRYIRVRKQLVRHKTGLLRIPDGIRYYRTFRSCYCLPCLVSSKEACGRKRTMICCVCRAEGCAALGLQRSLGVNRAISATSK